MHITTDLPNWSSRTVAYSAMLSVFVLLGILALGSGWYQSGPWYSDVPYQLFRSVCHQQADRSFWLGGQPMAVCARCFGIYTSLWMTFAALPLIRKIKFVQKFNASRWLAVVFAVNIIDFIGNGLGFWSNTNITRFIMGLALGSAAILLFRFEFPTHLREPKENDY